MRTQSPLGEDADRRKAFRCPVLGPEQIVLLVLNRTEVPVQLIDESATGFAVRMTRSPKLKVGDIVRLRTRSGLHEVSVTHVSEEETAGVDESGDEGPVPVCRVGLERREDLGAFEAVPCWKALLQSKLKGSAVVIAACMFVVIGIAAAIFVGVSVWGPSGAAEHSSAVPRQRKAESPSILESIIESQSGQKPRKQADRPAGEIGTGRHASGASGGAKIFTDRDVARQLGLTAIQKEAIEKIAAASQEIKSQLQKATSDPAKQAEMAAAVAEEAEKQVLDLLSDRQRAVWQSMAH